MKCEDPVCKVLTCTHGKSCPDCGRRMKALPLRANQKWPSYWCDYCEATWVPVTEAEKKRCPST